MPLYKLMAEMSYEEMLGWFEYFSIRPVGWREDTRAAMIIRSAGVKAKPHELFQSLRIMEDNREREASSINSLKGSKLFSTLLGAKGGDSLQGVFDEI